MDDMHRQYPVAALLLVGLTGVATAASSKGRQVALKAVPAPVRAAAKRDAPNVRWLFAVTFDDNRGWYRLIGRDAAQHHFLYNVSAKGELIDLRTQLQSSEVPETVREAFRKKVPKLEPQLIYAVGREVERVVFYEFHSETAAGKKVIVFVSPDGRMVSVDRRE
jgi:hypothetical protein